MRYQNCISAINFYIFLYFCYIFRMDTGSSAPPEPISPTGTLSSEARVTSNFSGPIELVQSTTSGSLASQSCPFRLAMHYPRHQQSVLESLEGFRRHNTLCDVCLLVGNKQPPRAICAHRAVLAASSPYFRAMFTNDLIESKYKYAIFITC